jgi:hypothetical protein
MQAGRFQDTRPAEKITLAEAIWRYLEHVSSQKRPNSDHRDRIAAKAILQKFGQEISLTDGLFTTVGKLSRLPHKASDTLDNSKGIRLAVTSIQRGTKRMEVSDQQSC